MAEGGHHRRHPLLGAVAIFLVAVPVLVFSWAFGGMRGDVLRSVMPLSSVACTCGVLFLPQRRPGETAWMASTRVWRAVVNDSFFWAALALTVYLLIPLFNVGLSPLLGATAVTTGQSVQPPWPHLPFCVNRVEHAGVIYWFVPTLLSALGVRHALTRQGKRVLFEVIVWNATLMAMLGFVQIVTDARFPFWGKAPQAIHFFSVFAYPNMAGAYFTLTFTCALGLWILRIEDVENAPLAAEQGVAGPMHPRLHAHYPMVAAAALFCAVLATYCRAAIVLTSLLACIFIVYILVRPLAETGLERARRFRTIVSVGSLLLALAGIVYVYAPSELGRELKTVNAFSVSDRVTGKGQYHTRVATAIMRDYPMFGVGGWGYRHFCIDYLTREKGARSVQLVGGANVHNDYLQFLAEHGVVGFGFMALCLGLLMRPMFRTWQRLIAVENARARSGMGASSLAVFVVKAPVLWIFLGTVAVLVHAFGDCPLRAASVLSLLYVLQAVALGFLPRVEV